MNLKKYRILIVDDEESITDILKNFLDKLGYSVETTTDPLHALKLAESGDIKILLTDIKMPALNGIDLLEKVKQINGLIQVIIMTGYGSMENTISCLEQGANDYILKPFKKLDDVKNIIDLTIEKLYRWEKVLKDIYSNK